MKVKINPEYVRKHPIGALKAVFSNITDKDGTLFFKEYEDVYISVHYGGYNDDVSLMSYRLYTIRAHVRSQRMRCLKSLNNPDKFIEKVKSYQEKINDIVKAQLKHDSIMKDELKNAAYILDKIGLKGFSVTHFKRKGRIDPVVYFKAKKDGISFVFTVEDGFVYPSMLSVRSCPSISPLVIYRTINNLVS